MGKFMFFSAVLILAGICFAENSAQNMMRKYAYVFDKVGNSATDSMPIGNGDIAANVYTTPDALYLLLSKNDAYDGEGNSLKIGRVKISLSPNPFLSPDFKQELDISDGCIRIACAGTKISVWADANNPVYKIEISSDKKLKAKVSNEFWKRKFFQDKSENSEDALVWYHTNTKSSFSENMNTYRVAHRVIDIDKVSDPFLNHTFACMVRAKDMQLKGGSLEGEGRNFAISIDAISSYETDARNILPKLRKLAEDNAAKSNFQKHKKWWADFWERSYICASDADVAPEFKERQTAHKKFGIRDEPDGAFIVSQHYNIQRYMMACQSRGSRQVKFNGGLFTMPMQYNGKYYGEDERNWGRRHTFQNQRLLYWPMIQAGDYDLIKPFFEHYLRLLPIRKAVTKMWFGIEGAYYRENCEIAGDEIGDGASFAFRKNGDGLWQQDETKKAAPRKHLMPAVRAEGSQSGRPQEYIDGRLLPTRSKIGEFDAMGYHNFHVNSGLEICHMAANLYKHTRDEHFLKRTLLPMSREVLKYFELRFPHDTDGKINLEPSQALETYWYTKNDTPDIAGLHAVLTELLQIKNIPEEYRLDWENMKNLLPEIPTQTDESGKRVLAIAQKVMTAPLNSENPELYAAFPYEIFSAAKGNGQILKDSIPRRRFKGGFCWTQSEIFMAQAGIAHPTKDMLVARFKLYGQSGTAFPPFSRGFNDYIPDFDNNGSGSIALQRMLIQEDGEKILLLPAWPKQWNCKFKLRANNNTTVFGSVKDGKLVDFGTIPQSRKKNVSVCLPQ